MTDINTITLVEALPQIFAGRRSDFMPGGGSPSEIWMRRVEFRRPDHYLVAASSGTGKSSLCSYIYGNRSDYEGHILFNDTDIRRLSTRQWAQIRQRSIALLPQEMRIFGELTARENIDIKNRLTGYKTAAEIEQMMERLGIADKLDTPARLLSIGQQQRVAIVRTLCQPFTFILLDEPVSHLDESNNAIAAAMIEEEASRRGAAIIATSVGNNLNLNTFNTLRL